MLSVYWLASNLLHRLLPLAKWQLLLGYVLISVLNGIRYNRLSYAVLKERWEGEGAQRKLWNGIFVVLYIVGNVALVLGLVIWPQVSGS